MTPLSHDSNAFEQFIANHFKDKSLPDGLDTALNALRLDSLDLFDFVLAVESTFEVEVNVDAIDGQMSLREFHEVAIAR